MSNELLADMGYVLAGSKNLDYKNVVRASFKTFIEFLHDNELVSRTLLSDTQPLTDDFKLFESDLTPVGVSFFDKEFLKWLGRCDKGGDPLDLLYLKKQYRKFNQ